MHKVIQVNQEKWLIPYIDMNTKLRTGAKKDFEKDFFKLMNNAVFYITDSCVLFILELKIFMKILLMILKNGLTRLIMTKMIKDCFQ